MKQVHKITHPTGKIYIGMDSIGSTRYMGSPDMNLVNADFEALPDRIHRDYTLRKEIQWGSDIATEAEISSKEVEMIRLYRSNDPEIGYNRWPKPLIIDTRSIVLLCMQTSHPHNAGHHLSAESCRHRISLGSREIEGGGSGAWRCSKVSLLNRQRLRAFPSAAELRPPPLLASLSCSASSQYRRQPSPCSPPGARPAGPMIRPCVYSASR
jgi:hypothetical protein